MGGIKARPRPIMKERRRAEKKGKDLGGREKKGGEEEKGHRQCEDREVQGREKVGFFRGEEGLKKRWTQVFRGKTTQDGEREGEMSTTKE